jgi:hypothetical protein
LINGFLYMVNSCTVAINVCGTVGSFWFSDAIVIELLFLDIYYHFLDFIDLKKNQCTWSSDLKLALEQYIEKNQDVFLLKRKTHCKRWKNKEILSCKKDTPVLGWLQITNLALRILGKGMFCLCNPLLTIKEISSQSFMHIRCPPNRYTKNFRVLYVCRMGYLLAPKKIWGF